MSSDNSYNAKLTELNNSLDILNQAIQNDQSKSAELVEQQTELIGLAQEHSQTLLSDVNKLEAEKETKQREAQLKENSGNRLTYYNYMILVLIAGFVAYIGIYFIEKTFPSIPESIFIILKIIIVSTAIIFCLKIYMTIQSRDPLNFNKLNLVKPGVDSPEEVEKKRLQAEKEGDLIGAISEKCRGKDCCGENTVWDEQKMLCVPVVEETYQNIRPNEPSNNYNVYK
tara:strand:+ start:496 stop:1176 length:681 start_codon:yes stop_codon:yes gene_type:complete